VPLLKGAPLNWYERAISQFNGLLEAFQVDGRSPRISKLAIDGHILHLAPRDPSRVLQAPFPMEPAGIYVGSDAGKTDE
jgi:hypothetical protein